MADYGRLGEWNCRHNKYPIFPEEPPIYSDAELKQKTLDEQKQTEYKGSPYTPYEATQRMRELEREMRALRLEGTLHKAQYQALRETASASELEELNNPYSEARLKYRAISAEYSDFAKTMGLKEQRERVYYDSIGRIF